MSTLQGKIEALDWQNAYSKNSKEEHTQERKVQDPVETNVPYVGSLGFIQLQSKEAQTTALATLIIILFAKRS